MLANAMKAHENFGMLVLALGSDPVVGQMARRCLEDNTGVNYMELGDIHGVGIEAESIKQECPLDPVIGRVQQYLFYQSEN